MQKLKACFILIAILTCMGLSGCSDIEVPSGDNSASVVDDPMKTPIDTESTSQSNSELKSFAYGLSFGKENVASDGGKVLINPSVTGDSRGSVNVGLMVFVDGIPQTFTADNSNQKAQLHRFDTAVNATNTLNLTLEPIIDANLDNHIIDVAGIAYPDYYPGDKPSFGNYHKMLSPISVGLPIDNVKYSYCDNKKFLKLDSAVMSQEQISAYGLDEQTGVMAIKLSQDDFNGQNYIIKNNSLALTLDIYSTERTSVDYRISIYKNHEQVTFNEDYSFIDVKIEGGKFAKTDIEISNVENGDFVYCIAVPLAEKEVIRKSPSTIALLENVSFGDKSTSSSPSGSTDTDNSAVSQTPADIVTTAKSMPEFAVEDTLFFTDYDGKLKLMSSKNGVDAEKSASINCTNCLFKVHGKYIACIAVDDEDYYAYLYDKELNLIKSAKLNQILSDEFQDGSGINNIDFDNERIVYAYRDINGRQSVIRSCEWDLGNIKTVCELPNSEADTVQGIHAVSICDDFVAFWVNGNTKGEKWQSYGVSDFSGNTKIIRKDGVYAPQISGSIALWSDQHVDKNEFPSGEIVMYQDGSFSSFKTEEQSESQFAFLFDDRVLTLNKDGRILRIYMDGRKINEIAIEDGYSGTSALLFGNKVYIRVYGNKNPDTNVLIYEVN